MSGFWERRPVLVYEHLLKVRFVASLSTVNGPSLPYSEPLPWPPLFKNVYSLSRFLAFSLSGYLATISGYLAIWLSRTMVFFPNPMKKTRQLIIY